MGDAVTDDYWSRTADALAGELGVSLATGLSGEEASARGRLAGPNTLDARTLSRFRVLVGQFQSPLVLLLVCAIVVAVATGEYIDAGIVLAVVVATAGLGYSREYSAQAAAAALGARLHLQASVVRDGRSQQVPVAELVPGDIVLLAAGALVPADAVLVEATDFFVSEAALTGESFPVPKFPGRSLADAPLAQRTNCVFLGTNVRSGTARVLWWPPAAGHSTAASPAA